MKLNTLLATALLLTSLNIFAADSKTEIATFAGGCFWCMEPPFDKLDGVISTTSGYTGGQQASPTYKQVSAGSTGDTEANQIYYDHSQLRRIALSFLEEHRSNHSKQPVLRPWQPVPFRHLLS